MFGYFVSSINGSFEPLPKGGLDGCMVFTARFPQATSGFVVGRPQACVSGPSLTVAPTGVYSG